MRSHEKYFSGDVDRGSSDQSGNFLNLDRLDGICEIATIPESDELPYVFEVSRDQVLSFSFLADAEVSLTLCKEEDYDAWVDSGFCTNQPAGFEVHLQPSQTSSVEFRAKEPGCLIAVLVNLHAQSASVMVAATLSD